MGSSDGTRIMRAFVSGSLCRTNEECARHEAVVAGRPRITGGQCAIVGHVLQPLPGLRINTPSAGSSRCSSSPILASRSRRCPSICTNSFPKATESSIN